MVTHTRNLPSFNHKLHCFKAVSQGLLKQPKEGVGLRCWLVIGEKVTRYIFVPLSDDMIYNNPEKITGPLVAFNPQHALESLDLSTQERLDCGVSPIDAKARALDKEIQ